ncbi:MobH family relaxase [Hydrogenophaga sp. NH-16]|uniref:MobH family relaxase n=1 Tax=Hydrogenophaga sp. NH-16 TaxID=2184519 RepID=UPI000FD8BD35|nr:MobH family relaxase [Hydrogenophaga sp. NH-16]
MPVVRGHAEGWLRVLPATDLLRVVHGGKALDTMWRQSRLAQIVWERDLLPAVHRYAEFVQLMPASESHHHAHVGGLLSHTLEMTLAAMTWRNGHFFPEGASVEEMDAQRDEWTYVVFFAALLHDVGKIMADLRINWICTGIGAPLRWVPMSGPLTAMVQSRPGGEYLVEFTPKSARDYAAHSRLATILLQQVAPATALSFLAHRPQAFEALTQYLSGSDRASMLAQLVRKADQTSAQQALANGSRERFTTATSIPLIDLLMQSVREMLGSGTALPLNRSGAAGWVYDGSIWFVAKRLADAVRLHIRQHHPDETVPGENKNDRLFDTWQEYGCIQPNPQSGQAIWYVLVQGSAVDGSESVAAVPVQGAGENDGAYSHSLTMLRFPLDKVFEESVAYPPPMRGRIVVQVKRGAAAVEAANESSAEPEVRQESGSGNQSVPNDGAGTPSNRDLGQATRLPTPGASHQELSGAPKQAKAKTETLRAPVFKRPGKPAEATMAAGGPNPDGPVQGTPRATSAPSHTPPRGEQRPAESQHAPLTSSPAAVASVEPPLDKWLDFEDDASAFKDLPKLPQQPLETQKAAPRGPSVVTAPPKARASAAKRASKAGADAAKSPDTGANRTREALPSLPPLPAVRPLLARSGQPPEVLARAAPTQFQTAPVILSPFLPELPHETASRPSEPTPAAVGFIEWLQKGLSSRALKYNETGALVHFVAEGMALVSPLVFRTYAAETVAASDAQVDAQALQVQREVIKSGWHLMGPGKVNILKYQVMGRGGVPVGKLSAVVLTQPDRWVVPVPPVNPVLKLV